MKEEEVDEVRRKNAKILDHKWLPRTDFCAVYSLKAIKYSFTVVISFANNILLIISWFAFWIDSRIYKEKKPIKQERDTEIEETHEKRA